MGFTYQKWIAGTHALLSQGSTDYDRKRQELFDIYYPMEISPNIPVEEKTKLMETWYFFQASSVMFLHCNTLLSLTFSWLL